MQISFLRTSLFFFCLGGPALFAQDAQTPISDGVNSKLPAWLRFGGEERSRMEYIVGESFKPIDDLYLLNRLRLNMDVLPLSWLKFSFQAEDSRVFGQNTLPAPATQKDAMDLRIGYVQVGGEESPVTLSAGRQPLDFGEGRLLADPNWSNVGRTFDAWRVTLRHGTSKLDLFSGTSVKVNPLDFDMPTPGQHFHGAYGSLGGLVSKAIIEPYVFWRLEHNYKSESGKPGNLDEKTVGFRFAGKLPASFDYGSEIAYQTGSWAGDSISAWTGRWVVGHTLPNADHKPRFFVEYARASGDAASKDGQHGTFDTLFASSHDKYGLIDLFGSSNIVYFRPGFQYTVRRGLTLSTAYNDLWLENAHDGLYVAGKSVARSVKGAAGTHIGQEADFQALWTVSRATQFTVGYGRLFPGEFLQSMTTGMPYNLLFLNLAQRF
jgi:hypothetical protein